MIDDAARAARRAAAMRAATVVGLPQRELAAARAEPKFVRMCHGVAQRLPRPLHARERLDLAAARLALRRGVASRRPSANSRVSASVYAPTVSASPSDFSCSVGVSSSFSTMRCVISSTRARASGGSADSLKSSRSSSARRMLSNRCRSATTVGIAPRDAEPGAELLDFLGDDRLGARDLAGAPREVLADGRLQIVDVVEEHLLDLAGRRLDVARHRDVDDEQRPVAPRPHHRLDVRLGEDRRGRAGGRDDDVAGAERGVQLLPRRGAGAADRLRRPRRVRHRPADDRDVLHALRLHVQRGQLAHLAGADDEDAAALQVAEDLPRERDRGEARPTRRPSRGRFRCARACRRANDEWNRRLSTGPTVCASLAAVCASFTWPRICGSPTTSESRPAATRNRCRAASRSATS